MAKAALTDWIDPSAPALTKQVSKETYYRGKRDLLCADFESLPA